MGDSQVSMSESAQSHASKSFYSLFGESEKSFK